MEEKGGKDLTIKKGVALAAFLIATYTVLVFFDYKDTGSYQWLSNAIHTLFFFIMFHIIYRVFFGKWWVND